MHTWRNLTASIWSQPAGRTGIGGILLLSSLAAISLFWSPYSPQTISGPPLASPGTSHFLGTNGVGQDIFSQVLQGCRISVVVSITVAFAATLIGFLLGAAAGYFPKRLGVFLMRCVDVLMAIPRLPLIILLAAFLRPDLLCFIGVLVFLSWPQIARTIRAQVLSLRERDSLRFVRFCGGSFGYVLRQHLTRELFPLLLAKGAATASYAIVAEVGLSFLGLGDPTLKSWGMMIRQALDYPGLLWTAGWSWWLLPPSIMASLAVFSFTLAGYAMDDVLRFQET